MIALALAVVGLVLVFWVGGDDTPTALEAGRRSGRKQNGAAPEGTTPSETLTVSRRAR